LVASASVVLAGCEDAERCKNILQTQVDPGPRV
jgi:hypothetical protein